jgi:hypothetical protein
MRRPLQIALRVLAAFAGTLALLVVAAPVAAASYGRGWYGETTDKVVTYTGFSLIAFFTLFPFLMSMIQNGLERRKERRKALARSAIGNGRWPGGW